MAFLFKSFSVEDDRSTMKVGTDAVMLGAWASVEGVGSALDVGTGCGVIALMLAQRSSGFIHALEIDGDSAEQAHQNFIKSPWGERLKVIPMAFQDYHPPGPYDLIISNPPFFDNDLAPVDPKRGISRHTLSLSHEYLLHKVKSMLHPDGRLAIIMPPAEAAEFQKRAMVSDLYLSRWTIVFPKPGRKEVRWLMEYSFAVRKNIRPSNMCIRDENNDYSVEYLNLTKDFYLFS